MSDVERMLDDLAARASLLSEWESDFLVNATHWIAEGRGLGPQEYDVLVAIWQDVTARAPTARS